MDNTCFAYKCKIDEKTGKVEESCTGLTTKNCEGCKFYKRDWQLSQQKYATLVRNNKLTCGILKTRYSLNVNGHYEGDFDSIKEIDKWLKESKYAKDGDNDLEKEEIYAFNIIKIRKEEIR